MITCIVGLGLSTYILRDAVRDDALRFKVGIVVSSQPQIALSITTYN